MNHGNKFPDARYLILLNPKIKNTTKPYLQLTLICCGIDNVLEIENTMPFPKSDRVIFKNNPLDQVTCQLRFPPISKIDSESPVDFQEAIRGEYPKVTEKTEIKVDFPPELQNQIPDEIAQIVTSNHKRQIYDFIDSDDNWKITLTNNFLALTSNKYKCWEEFREHLLKPLDAITSIYSPPYFSRIGLRYKDLIKRSNLGLIGTPWCKLLSPYISGILSSTALCDFVENSASKIEIRLKDGTSLVRISHGIVIDTSDGESCYLIDSDFFNTEKTANEKVIEKLNYYNQMGTRLIQWCITDKLKGAMGQ